MARTANSRLQALMQEAGWSPAQLARSLRGIGAEQGLSVAYGPQTVRRWLEGTRPRPPAPALLLECLSRRLGRRVTAQEAGFTEVPAAVVDPTWEADPLHKLNQLTRVELDATHPAQFDARSFSLAALALPGDITSLFSSPLELQTEVQELPVGSGGADRIRGMSKMFHSAAEEYGGQHVRAALAAFLGGRVMPLLSMRMQETARRETFSATAQLTLLQATMCADSGQDRTAQHYFQVAARLAADVDDTATLAIILRAMATHAYDLGHHSLAVLNLAEQATVQARHALPAVQAYTQSQLAVLQAHHDRRAAISALARAERSFSQTDSDSGPFTAYPPGALHYQRGRCLWALGDQSSAVRALTASLRMRTPAEYRAAVLTRAHLAEMSLRIGHLEQAVSHWRAFLTKYPTLHSSRADRQLRAMRASLRPYHRNLHAAALLAASKQLV